MKSTQILRSFFENSERVTQPLWEVSTVEQPNLSVISYEGVFRRCVIITSQIFFFSK